jgi:hypothetical protein
MLARCHAEAAELEARAAAVHVDFNRALGLAVRARGRAGLSELLEAAAESAAGLKKIQFRNLLRAQLKLNATNKEIDAVFDGVTGGAGAALASVKELRAVLGAIAARAGVADPAIEAFLAKAAASRAHAETVGAALEALRACLQVMGQLDKSSGGNAPVLAQIGGIVMKRNLKLGEVIAKWGDVDKPAFRGHIAALGVVAEPTDVDAVFDLMDDDGGGTLDEAELKVGLKTLIDSHKSNQSSTAALEKTAAGLKRAAASQIDALVKKERALAEKRQREEEEERAREEARREAEAAAKAMAEAARMAEEEKKAAEKAAREEKLKAARGGATAAVSTRAKGDQSTRSIAAANAEARRQAEAEFALAKSKFKRRWRPPGLILV